MKVWWRRGHGVTKRGEATQGKVRRSKEGQVVWSRLMERGTSRYNKVRRLVSGKGEEDSLTAMRCEP